MAEPASTWYIVQNESGSCEIIASTPLQASEKLADKQKWGPFPSQQEAIARRVGLIRSGKCKPV